MESKQQRSRRGFMLGAATVGAAAAAVATLPGVREPEPLQDAKDAPPPPERGGGYHVSEHVKRYYKTTLI
jgi:hypothetical protein